MNHQTSLPLRFPWEATRQILRNVRFQREQIDERDGTRDNPGRVRTRIVEPVATKAVLTAIVDHADGSRNNPWCTCSASTLARESNLPVNTVRRAVAVLDRAGLIITQTVANRRPLKIRPNWPALFEYCQLSEPVKRELWLEIGGTENTYTPTIGAHQPQLNSAPCTPNANRCTPNDSAVHPTIGGAKVDEVDKDHHHPVDDEDDVFCVGDFPEYQKDAANPVQNASGTDTAREADLFLEMFGGISVNNPSERSAMQFCLNSLYDGEIDEETLVGYLDDVRQRLRDRKVERPARYLMQCVKRERELSQNPTRHKLEATTAP